MTIDITLFTDLQWYKMVDAGMSLPVPLDRADLRNPFVYQRNYGIFFVPAGLHQAAMSLLLAFNHGCKDGIEVAEKLKLDYSGGTADRWLEETPGAAFRSSVGLASTVYAANPEALRAYETHAFKKIDYLFLKGRR